MSIDIQHDGIEVDEIISDEDPPRFIPPWYAQPNEDEDQDKAEDYMVVSYCYSDENPIICVGHKHWPLNKETADLISAAPEMYAELKKARDAIATWAPDADEWLAGIDAALRKANGEKP